MSRKRKRCYRRSTPVGRLRRNVVKVTRHAELALMRMESWRNGKSDQKLEAAKMSVREVIAKTAELDHILGLLEKSNYIPPKRSSVLKYEIGQHVAVGPKHIAKYRLVFAEVLRKDPNMLKDLVVSNILTSGEVVVRRGECTPFLVAKSHLAALKESHGKRDKE
jgi:hypothetical protein